MKTDRPNYGTYRFPRERSWIERNACSILAGIAIGFAIGITIISVLFFL